MEDKYIFDKRVMKKVILKYGIIFLISLPILLFTNYYLNKVMSFWLVILIDVVIVLFLIFIAQLIINAVKNKKEIRESKSDIKYKKKVKTTNNNENNVIEVENEEIVEAVNSKPNNKNINNKKNKKSTIVIKTNKKDK